MIQLPTGYKPQPVDEIGREISLTCWGFSIGFGILTSWGAWKQTRRVNRKFRIRSVYIWALWADLFTSLGFGFAVWFYMQQHVNPGLPLFLVIVFFWSIQIQSQLQILLNRLTIIMPDKVRAAWMRWIIFCIILAISIMVAATWIPAAMEIAPIYGKINKILGCAQKITCLLIDGSLNYYYVRLVNHHVVKLGLTKYKPLVTFNTRIAVLSVGMDILLIGMMNYPDPYVVMSLHPPAYLIKLNIEMSMANLILKIAKSNEFINSSTCTTDSCELGYYVSEIDDNDNYNHNSIDIDNAASKFMAAQEVGDLETGSISQTSITISGDPDLTIEFENDEQPLRVRVSEIEVTANSWGTN